jgi:hypothetical protein
MANEITKLLPFRQYDDNDVINMFALNGTSVGAGAIVKVSSADLNEDLVDLVTDSSFLNVLGNAYSPLAVNPLRVTAANSGEAAIGITLRDVRDTDENGEKLRFYPQKKEELQCVLSGESVPVASKGVFTFLASAFTGSVIPAPATRLGIRNGGLFATAALGDAVVGTVLATGSRLNTDTQGGNYAIVKIDF